MARAIREAAAVERGLVLVGAHDVLSPAAAAAQLAEEAGFEHATIADAAHAVPIEQACTCMPSCTLMHARHVPLPIEQAIAWRRAVLAFLDE